MQYFIYIYIYFIPRDLGAAKWITRIIILYITQWSSTNLNLQGCWTRLFFKQWMLLNRGRPLAIKAASVCLTRKKGKWFHREREREMQRGGEKSGKIDDIKYLSRVLKQRRKQDRKRITYRSSKLNLCLSLNHIIILFIKVVFTEAIHRAQSGLQPSQWLQLLHIHTVTEAIHRGQRQKMEWIRQFGQATVCIQKRERGREAVAAQQLHKTDSNYYFLKKEALETHSFVWKDCKALVISLPFQVLFILCIFQFCKWWSKSPLQLH